MTRLSHEGVQRFERKQMLFGLLGLLIVSLVSVILNTLHMNAVATQSTKFISRMIQLQEFREVGLTLEDARLDYFTEIHYISNRHDRSFSLPALKEFKERPGFFKSLTKERVTVPTVSPLNPDDVDHIVYVYSRFRLIPQAVAIWFLLLLVSIPQTRIMKARVIQQYEKELSLERDRAQAIVSKEVRHNLRTPLAALMRIPARLPDSVKEDRDLLKSTIGQIRFLIARLGRETDCEFSERTSVQIYDSLVQSVQEIALAVPHGIQLIHEIDDGLISAHVPHIPQELRALLGNIVGNSVDAMNGSGTIILRARDLATDVEIEIQDSGCGIPVEIIEQVFNEGFSFGKTGGTGMGLHHAKRWIEAWNGEIRAASEAGRSTTITIHLPIDDRAPWYVPRIRLHANQPVFVVEDQESARHLWRIRIEEAGLTNAKIFSSPQEFREAMVAAPQPSSDDAKPALFFDYDLGAGLATGIDLFSEIEMPAEKYLVTGHFDDFSIRQRCESEKILLLPKSQLPDIPFVLV